MSNEGGTVIVLVTCLPIDTAQRSGYIKKGLLRRVQELQTGDFSKVYLPIDPVNQKSLGKIAVVRYTSEEDAQRSIDALNGMQLIAEHPSSMERVKGWKTFAGLVERGMVNEGEVGQMTTLQIVGGNL